MVQTAFWVFLLVLFFRAGGGILQAQQQLPGLFNPDGTPHEVPAPHSVTGRTLNVLDYGADPADNSHDDLPAVLAAVQEAQDGDEIYFPAGVYNFFSTHPGDSHAHIVLKSGVNLRGAGRDSTVLRSEFGDKTINRFLKMRGVSDICISNMTLTSAFSGHYSTDTGSNNPEAGGPKYVISIEDDAGFPSFNITVDSVLVEKYRVHGVRLSNSHDVVVRNSVFQKATDVGGGGAGYGVSIQGNRQFDNFSKFNVVENCTFLGPYIRHGVLLQYATHNNLVRDNYLENTRLDAIDLHGEDEYLNEITGNEVRDVLTGGGVGVGNTGATHDASGPLNYIHHNTFINCREGVKVYLGSPDTRIEYNEITGSTVSGGRGIYLLNAPRTVVKGNLIHDNPGSYFSGILLRHDSGTRGRYAGDPREVLLAENEIYHNGYGIRIEAGQNIVLENNNVHDNRIQDFYSAVSVIYHKRLDVAVRGEGRVELTPPGGSYAIGVWVTLRAWPAANWRFDHWEGDLTGSSNPDSLQIDENRSVTAVFVFDPTLDQVTLYSGVVGRGHIELTPPGGVYDRGDTVTVRAVPDTGWKFTGWQRDLTGTDETATLVMTGDKHITASFAPLQVFTLAFWVVGHGHVEVSPPGKSFYEGTKVVVQAVPDSGWVFSGWGGDLSGTENPDTLVMDSDKAVVVTFGQTTSVVQNNGLPRSFELNQNYPNPFRGSTQIRFLLPHRSQVRLELWDITGRKVRILAKGSYFPGEHVIWLNATDLPAGVYFCRLRTPEFQAVRRMIVVR